MRQKRYIWASLAIIASLLLTARFIIYAPQQSDQPQEYRNDKYGVSIKYPSSWHTASERDEKINSYDSLNIEFQSPDYKTTYSGGDFGTWSTRGMSILMHVSKNTPDVFYSADELIKFMAANTNRDANYISEKVTVGGNEGIKAYYKNSEKSASFPEFRFFDANKKISINFKVNLIQTASAEEQKIYEDMVKSLTFLP